MQRVASSTLPILMKPKPRERSDCWVCGQGLPPEVQANHAHPLVVDNGDLFDSTKTSKLLIQVTFLRANAQAEDTQHSRGGGRLWNEM